jgi:transcriptional regulator with XRE-family HTH domain
VVLVRQEIGDVLRDFRLQKGQTLRQVASRASVALGYLSEVERGQKEASSEILGSLAEALEVPISVIMREVSDRLALVEGVNLEAAFANEGLQSYIPDTVQFVPGSYIPDTVPAAFLADNDPSLASSR